MVHCTPYVPLFPRGRGDREKDFASGAAAPLQRRARECGANAGGRGGAGAARSPPQPGTRCKGGVRGVGRGGGAGRGRGRGLPRRRAGPPRCAAYARRARCTGARAAPASECEWRVSNERACGSAAAAAAPHGRRRAAAPRRCQGAPGARGEARRRSGVTAREGGARRAAGGRARVRAARPGAGTKRARCSAAGAAGKASELPRAKGARPVA